MEGVEIVNELLKLIFLVFIIVAYLFCSWNFVFCSHWAVERGIFYALYALLFSSSEVLEFQLISVYLFLMNL